MDGRLKKSFKLIIFVLVFIFIVGIAIPLVHDIIFDSFSVSNYEVEEGIVSDVIIKEKGKSTCENIIVDDYNIFVKCGEDYRPQFNIGDRTEYYIYKGKGYHTVDQMKSGSFIGKIIDFGMIGTYILLLCLISINKGKLARFVDEIAGNKDTN